MSLKRVNLLPSPLNCLHNSFDYTDTVFFFCYSSFPSFPLQHSTENAVHLPKQMRCSRCHVTLHYCPCCGAAAFTAERASSSKSKGHSRAGPTHPLPSTSAGALTAGEAEEAWTRTLPPRPVSAYEVFKAEQQARLSAPASSCNAMSANTADASSAATITAGKMCLSVVDAPLAGSQQEQQRATAVAWLRLDAVSKQRYEEAAQKWASELANSESWGAGESCTASAVSPQKEPTTVHVLTEDLDEKPADSIGVAAAAASTRATSLPPLPPPPSTKRTPTKPPASTGKAPPTKATRAAAPTSFSLFRASIKKRRWTVAHAAAVWQKMSAEEKSRYDAAAAAYRTEGLLPAGAAAAPEDNSPVPVRQAVLPAPPPSVLLGQAETVQVDVEERTAASGGDS